MLVAAGVAVVAVAVVAVVTVVSIIGSMLVNTNTLRVNASSIAQLSNLEATSKQPFAYMLSLTGVVCLFASV